MEEASDSSTGNSRKRKIDEIHHNLKYKLAHDHLDKKSAKKFRSASSLYLSPADKGTITDPFEIMDRLEAGGYLAPGQYDIIRKIVEQIKERNFVSAINDAERQIENIHQSEEKSPLVSSNAKINNIIAQTRREIDLHLSDKSYVCLPVVEHGQKIVQQTGFLVFVGPSGCGKTKSVLQIISNVTNGRVLKLQSLRDWPEMVEVKVENWVWFDDVFEYDDIDKNRSMIATIKSCVHDGSSKVIFTVTNDLYKQRKLLFQKFIPSESIIDFEESPYSLCATMKYKILHSHLRVNNIKIKSGFRPHLNATSDTDGDIEIYESDVQEIALKKPLLGFPQSCSVFCKHQPFLQKGHHFFDNPSEELLNAIVEMHVYEKEQFTALVYTFQNNGKLDFGTLDESRVLNLLESFSASVPRDIEACIRGAVDRLSWKYLLQLPMNVYQFTHTSIYKAVALSYARLSKTTKLHTISLLSNSCINGMVTTHLDKGIDYSVIYAGRELFSDLANLLSKRIKDDGYSLFRCEVFTDNEFIKSFIPSYQIPREHVTENLKHVFRYGKVSLAKSMLDSLSLTINDLDDKTFSQILKESSVYNQLLGVQFLIKERRSSPGTIKIIIECLKDIRQNEEITSYLVHSMSLSELDPIQLQSVSRVVAGDENVNIFKYFIRRLPVDIQMETLQIIARTIGRRNAKICCDVFLKQFPFKAEELTLYVIEGACTGGHNRLIEWAGEQYPEMMKKNAAYLLQHVELPSTLEILDETYNQSISKLEYSDALNTLCSKGKSLCVKVLIDRCKIFSEADIENAMCAALRKEKHETLNVIIDTFSIPHEIKNELVKTMRRSINMRPHSAYPFTPAPTPASVLSKHMFTPCSYEETQKHYNKKLCLKRCLDKQYLSNETNIYKRAVDLLSLMCNNSVGNDYKCEKCEGMLNETPEIHEDLIVDSAVFSCDNEKLLSLFLRKYPQIWKRILFSCCDDKMRTKTLLTSTERQYKHKGQPFLPHLLDFVVQKDENISGFIQLLSEIKWTIDTVEFIAALEKLVERKTENAEILFQNMEELTLENKTFVPLQLSCKCNHFNAFRFIWSRTRNQEHMFYDFLVNNIVDENGEAISIMLSDLKSHISIDEVLKMCFDNRASKWISNLSRMYKQQFLESVESYMLGLCDIEDQGSVKVIDISVFKCIWKSTEKKQEMYMYHHFISKDIVDKNGEIVKIMIQNSDGAVNSSDILSECLRCCAKHWISVLSRTYPQQFLDSVGFIMSGLCDKEDQGFVQVFDISVFKCIWKNTDRKQEMYHHFISKDIVDKNGEIVKIMIQNSDGAVYLSDILLECFRCHAEKWISTLCRVYPNRILHSTESITFKLLKDNDPTVLVFMVKHLDVTRKASNDLLLEACRKGWKAVIQEVLQQDKKITSMTIVDSIKCLVLNEHYNLIISFEGLLNKREFTGWQREEILDTMASVCRSNDDILIHLKRVVLIPSFASRIFHVTTTLYVGVDFIIRHLSIFFKHIEKGESFRVACKLGKLAPSLTVQQKNDIIQIILESASPYLCVNLLSEFLPRCREIKQEIVTRIVKFASEYVADEGSVHYKQGINSLIHHLLNNFSILFSNASLLKCAKPILRGYVFESRVKICTFELIRERDINIFEFIRQLFYGRCSEHSIHSESTDDLFKYLIEKHYLDENEITEGIKICLFRNKIENQAMATMLIRTVGAFLQFDELDAFRRICKCENITADLVECVVELYGNNFDDISLELGIRDLILHNDYLVAKSTVIVNTVVGRKVNISSCALPLFTMICNSLRLRFEPSIILLRYIMEMYIDRIQENVIDGFNKAIFENPVAAKEICKALPGKIVLSEDILYFFLVRNSMSENDSELTRELSNVLHADTEMCAKVVEGGIPREERWRILCSIFGSSITEDMIWRLLRLCRTKCGNSCGAERVLKMLSDSDIVLTTQQRNFLEKIATCPSAKSALSLF